MKVSGTIAILEYTLRFTTRSRLLEPTEGRVFFRNVDLLTLANRQMKSIRRDLQFIFQDPFASLNPRLTIEQIVGLPLQVHGVANGDDKKARVTELLEKVGLRPAEQLLNRHPHEFSGGQRQRIGIARAIALNPKFIIADEPVSALDVSVRSQILNLLQDLKDELGLTYLLISHDLSVVRYMSDWIAVMYLGKIMEYSDSDKLFKDPLHPYTQALLAAVPVPDPDVELRITLVGEMPSLMKPPSGCRFHTRCPSVMDKCKVQEPQLLEVKRGHFVACHLY